MVGTMFVGIIPNKPSRDFTRPLWSPMGLKGLLHMLNAIIHPTKRMSYLVVFQFYFLFCIVKELAICKFEGVISVDCYTFKPLNLHMLILWHYYLFDFVLFYYFQVLNKDAINFINFGLKAHFEKT
jgi:hypothetical protein